MKIYLDTGNVEEIREAAKTGMLDGVTTNPTLIAKEGKNFEEIIKEIVLILKQYNDYFTVSCEVTNTNSAEDMIKEARTLSKINKHILVKIPLTVEGLKAVRVLSNEKIRCNVTLCFSANQALLAAKAGAWCVSPFVGRVDDEGYNGIELLRDIKEVYDNYSFHTQILAASIRSAEHVSEASLVGIDIATMPYSIFKKMYYNPLTDLGLERFNKDWNEYKNKLR